MKRILLTSWMICQSAVAFGATAPTYINNGTVSTAIQIDAETFINNGTFQPGGGVFSFGDFAGSLFDFTFLTGAGFSFDTSNTRVFINRGLMSSFPGFRLEYITNDGFRRRAESITNERGASLRATTLSPFFEPEPYHYGDGGYLYLNATNIVNRGSISAGFYGDINIQGHNVDLARSSVEVLSPSQSSPDFLPGETENIYWPAVGVEDVWWRYGEDPVFFAGLASGEEVEIVVETPDGPVTTTVWEVEATSPRFRIENEFTLRLGTPEEFLPRRSLPTTAYGPFFGTPIGPPLQVPSLYYIQTNALTATNQLITVVFVNRNDPNLLVDVGFSGSGNPDLPAPGVNIFAGALTTNVVFGGYEVQGILIEENFGNSPIAVNFDNQISGVSLAPGNIFLSRLAPQQIPISRADVDTGNLTNILSAESILPRYRGVLGGFTNAPFRSDLFTVGYFPDIDENGLTYTNFGGTNAYVTYAAYIDPLPSRIPSFNTNVSITNLSGRIAIDAENLNMSNTRMQASGVVNIKTRHFTSSAGTAIVAPNANLELGSTNGTLVLQGIVPPRAEGLEGYVGIYVTGWTNVLEFERELPPEIDPETGEPEEAEVEEIRVEGIYHFVYVDLNLVTSLPVQTRDLKLTADNIVLADSAFITGITAGTTTNLTVTGSLNIVGSENFDSTNFPMLDHLNNSGIILIPNIIELGTDRARTFQTFNNSGSIFANGLLARAVEFTNDGFLSLSGPVNIQADRIRLGSGGFFGSFLGSDGNITLAGRDVSLGDTFVDSSTFIRIDASESLTTSDGFFQSALSSPYGFEVTRKPQFSDTRFLLLDLQTPKFEDSLIYWPATDMGTTPAGFENNLAISGIVFDPDDYSIISFRGPDAANAIYVDFLDFPRSVVPVSIDGEPDFTRLAEYFDIPNSFTVYYLGASVEDFDISLQLDGQLNGRFRRVELPDFESSGPLITVATGANSAVQVTRALRYSTSIDSDGDGIVNALDSTPFEGVVLKTRPITFGGKNLVELSWNGAAHTTYEVQSSSNIGSNDWKTVLTVKNQKAEAGLMKAHDHIHSEDGGVKVYRVLYKPKR